MVVKTDYTKLKAEAAEAATDERTAQQLMVLSLLGIDRNTERIADAVERIADIVERVRIPRWLDNAVQVAKVAKR